MLTSVCCLLFCGVKEVVRLINLAMTGGDMIIPTHVQYVFANAVLLAGLGVAILLLRKKSQVYNYIWLLTYALGAGRFWDLEYRLMLPQLIMIALLLFIAITGSINPKHNASVIVSRVLWFVVLAVQIFMFIVLFNNTTISMAGDMYIAAWMLAILMTMAETIPFLKMYRRFTLPMAGVTFIMFALYLFAPGALIVAEEPLTRIMYYLPAFLQGAAVLCYAIWLHKAEAQEKSRVVARKVALITGRELMADVLTAVIAGLIGVVYVFAFWTVYARDIGVRKQQAEIAYHEIYRWEEYYWGEMNEDDVYVQTKHMEYSIVDLNDGNMPVLFLHTTQPPAIEGFSRVVFYDEETGKPYQVLGFGMNCIGVVGYIPCDEDHEYPIIVFEGDRQAVKYEFIYEVRDQQLIEIAGKIDLPYYGSDVIDTDIYHNPDEYYWNGEPVTIDQYYQNRDSIISGYTEITWLKGA